MATIDEILDAMPEEDAATGRDYLVIDPATRSITVPASERIFGVEGDEDAERKYFICPRFVGDNLDLAGMFLTVYWRNANGDGDGYLVEDVEIQGDYVTFSWLLWPNVVAYKGAVQFSVCADLPNTAAKRRPDWNTTTASGEVLEGLDPDLGDVEGETSDVVTQLRAEIAASTAAVEAAGAAQVDVVKAQGTNTTQEAVAAIQAQGEATRASIPADYTTLAAQMDKLTRDRAAAIVCEAEGDAIQVQDASNDPLQGLRIFGKSTQDGTPTPDAPVEIVSTPAPVVTVAGKNRFSPKLKEVTSAGVTVTQTADGNYKVNGTRTGALWVELGRTVLVAGHKYTLSANSLVNIQIWDLVADKSLTGKADGLYSKTFTPKSTGLHGICLTGNVSANDYTNVMADIVVSIGEEPASWEPYTGQALTINTPGRLPGIPVASGGNYTDANGQQWIADEVDLARGVYVQRVGAVTLDASTDEYWYTIQATGGTIFGIAISGAIAAGSSKKVCCTHFTTSVTDAYNKTGNACYFYDKTLRVCHMSIDTLDDFKTWLAENPTTVLYQLADPVEVPLSDVELQAFLAMHSNKPTTTVLNDAGAHMVLEYAADPKTYIDNKLAALVAANN